MAVYHKMPGEDSEKLNAAPELRNYHPVYRLDKPVEGIVLLEAAHCPYKLSEMENTKNYTAVVAGSFEVPSGTMNDLLYHDPRNNKTFPVKRMRKGVKEAELAYEVIGRDNERDLSLVRVTLKTGRTHQIRVQFASRKHPLYGDGKYGSRFKGLPALCCSHLEFIHPQKNSPMAFDIRPEGEPWSFFS